MASRTAQRSADEERFREFRARRLEKKEADRLKLTAEFPLLFNNKAVGNKVLSSSLNLNAKTLLSPTGKTAVTPAGKRRSVAADKNDENCAYSANKSATKLSLGAKTPLSSKKQRKGSMIGSKIPISQPSTAKAVSAVAISITCVDKEPTSDTSACVSETPNVEIVDAVTPEPAAEPAVAVAMTEAEADRSNSSEAADLNVDVSEHASLAPDSPVVDSVKSQAETVPQGALEPAAVVRKALFEDAELEQFTSSSTRSSLSSLGESIAGDLFASRSSDEAQERESSIGGGSAVQEQVLDVLDYLLELDEVDEVTYRRMSSQAFSVKTLKRLSMNMTAQPPKEDSPAPSNEGEQQEGEQPGQVEGEGELEGEGVTASRRSSDVPMEMAYPESAEDCVIGELDVLNALRNYLAAVTREPEAPPAEVEAELATAEMPISEFQSSADAEETAEMTATSARSSGNSVTTFDPRPQWTSAGDSSVAGAGSQRSSVSSSARSSLDSCCTTTMRVSFATAGAVSASLKRKSVEAPTQVETEAVAVPQAAPSAPPAKKAVVTHPMADLLNDALMRGLVVPSIIDRLEMGNHTKYIVQTQILSVPGYPEENSRVRMMALKRYSDFKNLRAALIELMDAKRRADVRAAAANTPGKRSSLDGDDILSLARSRRSSVESCYRESLLNARDSLCIDIEGGGFERPGRESELLPPLPSRQIMSMTCASLQQEEDFQATREAFLRTWLETVFSKQSCESTEYRTELRKFLSA